MTQFAKAAVTLAFCLCCACSNPTQLSGCLATSGSESCTFQGGAFGRQFCDHATGAWGFQACPATTTCQELWQSNGTAWAACIPTGGDAVTAADSVGMVKEVAPGPDNGTSVAAVGTCSCPPGQPCTPCPQGEACITGQCYTGWCGIETCGQGLWCPIGTNKACQPVQCTLPAVTVPRPVSKVIAVRLLAKTEGCDLDGDSVIDNNAAGALAQMQNNTNQLFSTAIADGELVSLFEAPSLTSDGKPFSGSCLQGQPAPNATGCNLSSPTAACNVWVRKQAYLLDQPGTCQPRATCQGTYDGKNLTLTCAGAVPQPIVNKPEVELPGYGVTLNGSYNAATGTGTMRMCGVYKMSDILALLDALPAAAYKSFGTLAQTQAGLKSLIKPDIDTDKDGTKDAVSFAADVDFAPAMVTGQTQ